MVERFKHHNIEQARSEWNFDSKAYLSQEYSGSTYWIKSAKKEIEKACQTLSKNNIVIAEKITPETMEALANKLEDQVKTCQHAKDSEEKILLEVARDALKTISKNTKIIAKHAANVELFQAAFKRLGMATPDTSEQ